MPYACGVTARRSPIPIIPPPFLQETQLSNNTKVSIAQCSGELAVAGAILTPVRL